MIDTIFVQFTTRSLHKQTGLVLSNGFSHTYKECKNLGDFVWIPAERKAKLPISKGTVYVSTFFPIHMFRTVELAARYPEINFVVGGPSSWVEGKGAYYLDKGLSPNVDLRRGLVEKEIFNQPGQNKTWGIELPNNLENKGSITLGYTVNRTCYWGKCAFCGPKWTGGNCKEFQNTVDHLQLPEVDNPWKVWLYTPCLRPQFIVNELPKLKDKSKNCVYFTHVRADTSIVQAFRKMTQGNGDLSYLFVIAGVEFPSKSMLKRVRKGIDLNSVVSLVKTLTSHNCEVKLSFMLGWNVLTADDVDAARRFAETIHTVAGKKIRANVWHLMMGSPFSRIRDINPCRIKKVERGTLNKLAYYRYIPILDKKQHEFNQEVLNIYHQHFVVEEKFCMDRFKKGEKCESSSSISQPLFSN